MYESGASKEIANKSAVIYKLKNIQIIYSCIAQNCQ